MASLRILLRMKYLLVLCVSSSVCTETSHKHYHSPLFVFGDSLFDVGNNNFMNTISFVQANYHPYGHSFFNYPTGRFSDGRVIPDFIAEYAKLPLLPPFLHSYDDDVFMYGVNFASAGAGALVHTYQGTVIDLKAQACNFKQVVRRLRKKLGDEEAEALLARAVYIISVGGNDYSAPLLTNSRASNNSTLILPYPPQQFVHLVIANISTFIQEIYEEGGRKFGILNVGPLNCFPMLRTPKSSIDACQQEQISTLALLHRNALPKMLQNLHNQLKAFQYSLTDFYDALLQLMKYPSKYGFEEGEVACCGGGSYTGDYSFGGKRGISEYEICENVSAYVFFDAAHPTQSAAQHFANLMWSGNSDFVHPYNLKQLFEF